MPEVNLGRVKGDKGDQGVGIQSVVFKEQNSNGSYVYTITLTNGITQEFIAPIGPQGNKGDKGEKGDIGIVSLKWEDLLNVPATFPSTWTTVSGKPTIFPTNWANVADKPTIFPTNWSNIANIPATLPSTWSTVSGKPTIFPTNWANVADKPTTYNDTTAVKLAGSTMTGDLKGAAAKSISGFGKVYNPVWG